MAQETYQYSQFVNAPQGPAFYKLEKETDPLGFVVGMIIDDGKQLVTFETTHQLDPAEKSALDAVVAAHTGKPDIIPFRGCCIPTYANTAALPSDAEMAARAGPCIVGIDTPKALAIWIGTWKVIALP
jgi:hypothetical protein